MANPQQVQQAILRLQPAILTDAEQIAERDLQAIFVQLSRNEAVAPAQVDALRTHIDTAFARLRAVLHEVVLPLVPPKEQYSTLVIQSQNHLAGDCQFLHDGLQAALLQIEASDPALIDVNSETLDDLQETIETTRTHLHEIEHGVVDALRHA